MKTVVPVACLMLACALCAPLFAQNAKSELRPVAFATLDSNKDGKLSLSEARADPDLYMAFESLDTNHDGFLTPQEFQAWPRAAKTKGVATDPTTTPSGSAGSQHMPPN